MKTLVLIRHADTLVKQLGQMDWERPLSTHGIAQAQHFGRTLQNQNIHPDWVVCSHALRAQTTAQHILNTCGAQDAFIYTDKSLYHGYSDDYWTVIENLPEEQSTVLIIGHNPTLSAIIGDIMGEINISIQPCCGVILQPLTYSWSQCRHHPWRNITLTTN